MARPKNGRPTKYKKEYPQLVLEYIKECQNKEELPFVVEFAHRIGVNKDTIYQWCKINKGFSDSIRVLNEASELMLVKSGIKRKYDPSFARFILAANHGYVETSKQINEGQQPVTIQVDMSGGYLPPQATTQPPKPKVVKPN